LVTLLPVNAPGPADQPALPVRPRAAFTLVEIVLVVALLGFIAALFLNSAADLFRVREPRLDEVFWQGVASARQLALETNQTVVLRYDGEKHVLAWTAGSEAAPHTLAFPGRLVEFLPVTEQGLVLLGGQAAETGALARVQFYPDGGCDAFRAQLTDAAGKRAVLTIDQWTCAPVIAATPP
jgi:hypothetical protein